MNPTYRTCANCQAAKRRKTIATWDGPTTEDAPMGTLVEQVTLLCVRRSVSTWREVQPEQGCFDSIPKNLNPNPF